MEPRSICELPDKRPAALERKLRFRRNIKSGYLIEILFLMPLEEDKAIGNGNAILFYFRGI
ncbi:MAG: hypothetical protein KAJ14_04755 [Candidatus Omnitrophica bacterium]|nr:hypothetical protein [Candidatus Omnitrophota bacterium]